MNPRNGCDDGITPAAERAAASRLWLLWSPGGPRLIKSPHPHSLPHSHPHPYIHPHSHPPPPSRPLLIRRHIGSPSHFLRTLPKWRREKCVARQVFRAMNLKVYRLSMTPTATRIVTRLGLSDFSGSTTKIIGGTECTVKMTSNVHGRCGTGRAARRPPPSGG